jgi:hypothetical protein
MRLILKKHRNILLELIRSAQLEPQAFRLTEEATESTESLRLDLSDSPHYFVITARFQHGKREFWYEYSTFLIAYPNPTVNKYQPPSWMGFHERESIFSFSIVSGFRGWLSASVKKYLDYLAEEEEDRMLPDLWGELRLPPSSSSSLLRLQNTPFSKEEQARISESLHEYLEEVKKRETLTTEQLNLLQEQVEDLVESSKRLGRKDWLQAAVGALIGVTLSAGLTSPVAVEVIRLAGEALQWLARTPLLLPQYRGF